MPTPPTLDAVHAALATVQDPEINRPLPELDLPPGTGDMAISIAQLLPNAEILVVTTPQLAAAEVAERAGAIATQTHQQVVGVIENMSWLDLPDGSRMEIFGSGGGETVSDALTRVLGA